MALDEDVEIVGMPESGFFKAVQIIIDGHHPVIVCGNSRGIYHKNLLVTYLDSQGISYETFISDGGQVLPCLTGQRYEVTGMGMGERNSQENSVRLEGMSADYGIISDGYFEIKINQQLARQSS